MANLQQIPINGQNVPLTELRPAKDGFIYQNDYYGTKDGFKDKSIRETIILEYCNLPYWKEWKAFYFLCSIVGTLASLFCVFLAVLFVADLLSYILPIYPVCIFIAVIGLLLLECGKSLGLQKLVKAFEKKQYAPALMILIFVGGAFYTSINTTLEGSQKLFYTFGTQVTDIESDYEKKVEKQQERIDKINDQISEALAAKSAMESQRFFTKAAKTYDPILADLNKQIENIQYSIDKIGIKERRDTGKLSQKLEANTSSLFMLSGGLEFIILLCNLFIGNFKRISSKDYQKTGQFLPKPPMPNLAFLQLPVAPTAPATVAPSNAQTVAPTVAPFKAPTIVVQQPKKSVRTTGTAKKKVQQYSPEGYFFKKEISHYIGIYAGRAKNPKSQAATIQRNLEKVAYLNLIRDNFALLRTADNTVFVSMKNYKKEMKKINNKVGITPVNP